MTIRSANPVRRRLSARRRLDVFGALFSAAVCLLIFATTATAEESANWLRDPAISPDGSKIAFRFEGQIWIAPVAGGSASPLTPAGYHAESPVWSPSGSMIAFASDQFGPTNIYVAPADGGQAKRLTWYSLGEWPSSFTPDGKSVLFSSRRLGDAKRTFAIPIVWEQGNQLYQVPVAGGRDVLVLPNAALDARWNRAQTRLLYTSASTEQPFRQHQLSSAARQVWIYDAASGKHERLTDDAHETRNAVWAENGDVYYLSEASGTHNVWRMSLADHKSVQITHFSGDPVRSLSISDHDDIAFSWRGGLYRLKNGATEPERINPSFLEVGFVGDRANRTTQIDDFVLSPNGKEMALVTRGQIFVAAMNGKLVKRIAHASGESRAPSFAPDGRSLVFASERDGHWSLYQSHIAAPDEQTFSQSTTLEETLIKSGDQDAMWPYYAPDGRHIAYVANRESVRVLDLKDKSEVEVLPKGQNFTYGDTWPWPLSWSPDSRWIALPTQLSQFIDNVAVAPADGERPAVRVAPSGEEQWGPQWSADGGVLLWANDQDALRHPFGDVWRADIEGVFASRAAAEAFHAKLREPIVQQTPASEPQAARADALDDEASPQPQAAPNKNAKSRKRELASFESDGIEDRKFTFSPAPVWLVYWGLLPDGVRVLQVENSPNPEGSGFLATGTILDLRGGQRRVVFSGLPFQAVSVTHDIVDSPVRVSADGKKLYFLSRGSEAVTQGVMEVDIATGKNRLIKVTLDTTRDEADARRAAFEQFWTLTKRKFFDINYNGVDWDAARAKYESFLPSIVNPDDLAELLSEMTGELGASHTGSFYNPTVPLAERTASLGLYYDEQYPGPGMKVAEIVTGGPFDAAGSSLKAGDVLLQIDGVDIPLEGGIRRALSGFANQRVSVTAQHPDGTRFTERHIAVTLARETQLARKQWKKRKRDEVVAKSCGRLGYVYVDAMDARSYRELFSEIFGRFADADGLIVDIRYNGGGNLHNHLLTLLSGKAYITGSPPRGGPPQNEPRDRWTKPSAVIMNSAGYSDASVFPHAYRDQKLGTLVGDPVAGTGTATWWADSKLIPGLVYGIPEVPLRELSGKRFENDPINPDIAAPSDATYWDRGEDPQLEAAMQALTPRDKAGCPPAQ